MIEPKRVAAILLAAGRSQRFGLEDKLVQHWRGKPLACHAADTLAALPFAAHIAVVSDKSSFPLPDLFETVLNREPGRGLSHSIALGVEAAERKDVEACLIALADMPLVPMTHFDALLGSIDLEGEGVIATSKGGRIQVPALFARRQFGTLKSLSGDSGARDLLRKAPGIACDHGLLADFDRPEDFLV